MMLAPSVVGTRVGRASITTLLVIGVPLPATCATQGGRATAAPAARPQVVTVPYLKTMVQNGDAVSVIISEIEGSGTVYRLTPERRAGLRADGMPVSILGLMQDTSDRAIQKNPALAKSDEHWIQMGDSWYGGLPAVPATGSCPERTPFRELPNERSVA